MKRKLLGLLIAFILLTIAFSGCNEQKSNINTENNMANFIGTWKNFLPFNQTYFYTGFVKGYTEWTFFNNETLRQQDTQTPISMGIGEHDAQTTIYWFHYTVKNNNLTITLADSNYSKIYKFEFDKNNSILNLKLVDTVTDMIPVLGLGDYICPGEFKLYRTDTPIFIEITGRYQEGGWIVDNNETYYPINGINSLDDEYYINKTLIIKGFIVLPIKLPEEYLEDWSKTAYFPGYIQLLSYDVVENS